jgi:rhamnosyltransferase
MDGPSLALPQQLNSGIKLSIGIIIPTYQGEQHLKHSLPPLKQALEALETSFGYQKHDLRLLIIDSSSTDNTVSIAKEAGAEVIVIPKEEFNHGATREKARKHLNTDITIMVTQDAYATPQTIFGLIKPLIDGHASIAYARQLPHDGAKHFETFARTFNYPEKGHIRSIADISHYGVYTFFCSNSCAAYLNSALDEIGGFPPVAFGEDTFAVAQLLRRNHKIAYVAEATVKHSHHYSLKEEFQRNKIIGEMRTRYRHLLECGSSDEKRGSRYAFALLKATAAQKPFLVPYAIAHLGAKWLGYQLGKRFQKIKL